MEFSSNAYTLLKKRLEADPLFFNFVKEAELVEMHSRLSTFYLNNSLLKKLPSAPTLTQEVALLIKLISPSVTCRKLTTIAYPEGHPKYEIQHYGRDLKRWAAMTLGELFVPSSLNPKEYQDFWHEY